MAIKKYLIYCSMSVKSILSYKKLLFFNMLFVITGFIIKASVLKVFFQNGKDIHIWEDTFMYIIFSSILAETSCFFRLPIFVQTIKNGSIIKYGIYPGLYCIKFFFEELGVSILSLITALPLACIGIVYLMFYKIYYNFLSFLGFLILSVPGIVISILFTTFIFSFAQLLQKTSGIKALLNGFSALLSGSFVPLIFFDNISIIKKLPLALSVNAPIEVFLNYDSFCSVISLQLFWIAVLFLLNIFITENLVRKMLHVGG